MSAVPLPAEVLAGTSDLPSSTTFILSAKAGPANATAAPSVSEASMVLFMGFSLLTSHDDVSFKTAGFCFYSRNDAIRPKISGELIVGIAVIIASRFEMPDDGPVNAATFLPCRHGARICRPCGVLVAYDSSGSRAWRASFLPAQSGQRPHNVQCRRMFLLPRRAQPARSHQARRRARTAVAVRHLLRPEHLARSERRHRALERGRFRHRGAEGDFTSGRALLSGVSLYVLPAREDRGRPRPLRLSEDAAGDKRPGARS